MALGPLGILPASTVAMATAITAEKARKRLITLLFKGGSQPPHPLGLEGVWVWSPRVAGRAIPGAR